jgi:hypothetical protein
VCQLGDALVAVGYRPFLAVGLGEGTRGELRLRLAGEARVVRQVSDANWQVIRDTLIKSLDRLRTLPLDDLEHA